MEQREGCSEGVWDCWQAAVRFGAYRALQLRKSEVGEELATLLP